MLLVTMYTFAANILSGATISRHTRKLYRKRYLVHVQPSILHSVRYNTYIIIKGQYSLFSLSDHAFIDEPGGSNACLPSHKPNHISLGIPRLSV